MVVGSETDQTTGYKQYQGWIEMHTTKLAWQMKRLLGTKTHPSSDRNKSGKHCRLHEGKVWSHQQEHSSKSTSEITGEGKPVPKIDERLSQIEVESDRREMARRGIPPEGKTGKIENPGN
jgi:hypothetical protein